MASRPDQPSPREWRQSTGNRGFAFVLTGVMVFFMGSLVGLAVDSGSVFLLRFRLMDAAQAAANAAAAELGAGKSKDEAGVAANAAGRASWERSGAAAWPPRIHAHVQRIGDSGWLAVHARAELSSPAYFTKFWGIRNAPVAAEAEVRRRNLVITLAPGHGVTIEAVREALANLTPHLRPFEIAQLESAESARHRDAVRATISISRQVQPANLPLEASASRVFRASLPPHPDWLPILTALRRQQ